MTLPLQSMWEMKDEMGEELEIMKMGNALEGIGETEKRGEEEKNKEEEEEEEAENELGETDRETVEPMRELGELVKELENEMNNETNNEPISETNNEPISETNNEPINETNNEPINKTNNEPISETNNEPISETNNEPINKTNNEPINEPIEEKFIRHPIQEAAKPMEARETFSLGVPSTAIKKANRPKSAEPLEPSESPQPEKPMEKPMEKPEAENETPIKEPLEHVKDSLEPTQTSANPLQMNESLEPSESVKSFQSLNLSDSLSPAEPVHPIDSISPVSPVSPVSPDSTQCGIPKPHVSVRPAVFSTAIKKADRSRLSDLNSPIKSENSPKQDEMPALSTPITAGNDERSFVSSDDAAEEEFIVVERLNSEEAFAMDAIPGKEDMEIEIESGEEELLEQESD